MQLLAETTKMANVSHCYT